MEAGLAKLFNVDGNSGRDIIPFPHNASFNPEVLKYDKMTVADRLHEIRNNLTPNERVAVEAFVLLCSGGTLETTSFFELLHWWALSEYSYHGCIEYLVKYKFRFGQSSFAIRFFHEAQETGNLSYVFNCPVASVKSEGDIVQVSSRDGNTFLGRKMISAMPLNVLNAVKFDPPLSKARNAAADIGHINQCIKVHAEIRDRHLRSWTGISYPHNKLIYGFGDGTTPAGNTHVVCFGAKHNHFHPEDDMQETMKALRGFVDMDIERIVSACISHATL
jgi:Flavin containing amine oxidoreductase